MVSIIGIVVHYLFEFLDNCIYALIIRTAILNIGNQMERPAQHNGEIENQ